MLGPIILIHADYDITYPPATEAQLQATETAIGGSLPILLRLLYQEVANGGCCIAGLPGALGGCPLVGMPIWWEYNQPVQVPLRTQENLNPWMYGTALPPHVSEALARYPGAFISYEGEIPCASYLWLSELRECGLILDGETGHLYWTDIGPSGVWSDGEEFSFEALSCQAISLEAYIERWLAGEALWQTPYKGEIRSTSAKWDDLSFEDVRSSVE